MTDIVGGKKISECTAATEINNADLFPLVQGSTNKYSLWSTVKSVLKTYFDGLYTPKGKVVGINDQTGTTYTLVLADAGKYVRCTNESAIALTVPTNASVNYDTGTVITIEQGGAGVITVAGDTDVTVNGYDSGLSTAGQYAVIQLLKTGSDEWTCIGGTTA